MPVANPYFINIELFWPNGTRPNQNEIARVNVFDVGESGPPTPQGQSGYDTNTGGWQDLILQNTAAFSGQRDFANLRFDVVNVQEQRVHVTQVFQSIKSGSTVRIVIGQGAQLVGDWGVSGTVTNAEGAAVTEGTVEVCDVTGGSSASLGTSSLSGLGAYSVTFTSEAFSSNGVPHTNPNILVKYRDAGGAPVAQSPLHPSAGQQSTINLILGEVSQVGDYRVSGAVRNELGLPVAGILVDARQLVWTTTGIQEQTVGVVLGDGSGNYEIRYTPLSDTGNLSDCAGKPETINLVVAAFDGTVGAPGNQLALSDPVLNAGMYTRVDLIVTGVSEVTSSEYSRLDEKLAPCLGTGQTRINFLNQLDTREDYLAFAASSSGVPLELLRGYVTANQIALRINDDAAGGINWDDSALDPFDPFDPEVIYGLIRMGKGASLEQLLEVEPSAFFTGIVDAAERNFITPLIEDRLAADADQPLQEQWRIVLAHFLSTDTDLPQTELLSLVISETARLAQIAGAYYSHDGDFASFLDAIEDEEILLEGENEDLLFVFELYEAVDQFFPAVKVLYGDKETREWKTIADLATVSFEEGSPPNVPWTGYAYNIASEAATGTGLSLLFPGDIAGGNNDEKARIYAQRLYDKFGDNAPEVRFADNAAADGAANSDATLTAAAEFIQGFEDFELTKTPIDQFVEEKFGDTPPAPEVIDKLKQLQRVSRLAPNYQVATALVEANFDSAVKIAQLDEDEFVAVMESLVGGLAAARAIHRKASAYASEVYTTLVRFNQSLNDRGGLVAIPGGLSTTQAGNSKIFPTWVTLFGALNSCADKHCQTVLSPGAYLADLLQFIGAGPRNAILSRRPELENIELTCANTDRLLPYIDLVIEVLESAIAPTVVGPGPWSESELDTAIGVDVAAANARTAIFARLQAAGYRLTERARVLVSALDQKEVGDAPGTKLREWVIEDDAWRFTLRKPLGAADNQIAAVAAAQTSQSATDLDVFPEHDNPGARQALQNAVFPLQLPLSLGREEVDLVLGQRGVSRAEILATFREGGEPQAPADDLAAPVSSAVRAQAALRLAAKEADAILAGTLNLREYWGFSGLASDVSVVTIRRPENPIRLVTGFWYRVLAEGSVFLQRSQLRYEQLQELLGSQFIQGEGPRLLVTATDLNQQLCNVNEYVLVNLAPGAPEEPGDSLDPQAFFRLRRISFFLRLQRLLGWSTWELDRYLMRIEQPDLGSASDAGVPQDFQLLAQVRLLAKELSLKVSDMLSFWSPLDRYSTERHGESQFDLVFRRSAPESAENLSLGRISRGLQDGVLLDNSSEGATGDLRTTASSFQAYIKGALRLEDPELALLWTRIVGLSDSLNLEHLSEMHRIVVLARALKLSVQDYFRLYSHRDEVGLLGYPAFLDPNPASGPAPTMGAQVLGVFLAVEGARRLQHSKMTPTLADYLLRDRVAQGERPDLTTEQLAEAHRLFASAGRSVSARYPSPTLVDSELVGQLLSEVMPEDKIPRVLELMRRPANEGADTADNVAFLNRYFETFAGIQLADLVTALLAASPELSESSRLQLILDALRPFLVEKARLTAALDLAASLTGLQAERVDGLLSSELSSVATPPRPRALDDWIAGVGGLVERDDGGVFVQAIDAVDGIPVAAASPRTWTSQWVIPADGEWRFVAEVVLPESGGVGETDFLLMLQEQSIDIETPPGIETQAGRSHVTFEPGTFKAGDVVSLSFRFSGEGRVSLLVRQGNDDPRLLTAGELSPFHVNAYEKLHKAGLFIQALSLNSSELSYLSSLESPDPNEKLLDRFPIDGGSDLGWPDLSLWLRRWRLNREVALAGTTLFDEWRRQPLDLSAARISALTTWRQEDIQAAFDWLWDSPPPVDSVETWLALVKVLRLSTRLNLSVQQIGDRVVAEAPSASVAVSIRDSYRARFTEDAWRAAFKPLRDKLRQRHRDALTGYLIAQAASGGPGTPEFFDENSLFAHFLVDTEMEPEVQLSRLKLALNSIQLFMQRVFLGLESRALVNKLEEKRAEWEWMKSYRVWEAARKIFLYPENWIEPELRDDKTELFKKVEERLLQDEVTDDRAEQVLVEYVEGLEELAHLVVVAAISEGVFEHGTTSVLHIVGRTRAVPYTYFHRTFQGRQFADGVFTPWKKVELEIDADNVAPVVVGGKLQLFWPMVMEKGKVSDQNNRDSVGPLVTIQFLRSTFNETTGKWSKPKLGKKKVVDPTPESVYDRAVQDDGPSSVHYSFRTGAEVDGTVRIEVLKTVQLTLPQVKQLGVFEVSASGEEGVNEENIGQVFDQGSNFVLGAEFQSNAALRNENEVDKVRQFGFLGSDPFFLRVDNPFRALVSNFGYIGSDREPFFFEARGSSMMGLHLPPNRRAGLSPRLQQKSSFFTFNHPQIGPIKRGLDASGPKGIMNREVQALPRADGRYYYNRTAGKLERLSSSSGGYLNGRSNRYNAYYGGILLGYHIAQDHMALGVAQREFDTEWVPQLDNVQQPYPLPTVEFAYGTPMGNYNWELFFHLPLFIADRLSQELRFEDALKWFHCVFDPRQELSRYEQARRFPRLLPDGARFWNFLPFFANEDADHSLLDTFGGTANRSAYKQAELRSIIEDWRQDPFNPHLVARQRIVAYQKSTVMKYLDNLVAWADQLFRRDTFESINEATQLYVLAADILGRRPELVESPLVQPRYTYRELSGQGLGPFSNALVEVESLLVATSDDLSGKDMGKLPLDNGRVQRTTIQSLFFRVPRNDKLDGYWDTVQDRLFKIRNSLNIDGIKRTLALFAPPIDPALLVKAAANGVDLSSVIAQLNRPQPHYRYRVWNQRAQDLANEVKSFGAALLSALEKKDAEALSQLRQSQEVRLMKLVKEVREDQIREAEENITSLELSRAIAVDRETKYLARDVNESEKSVKSLTSAASVLDVTSGVLTTLGGVVSSIPQFQVGAFSASIHFGGLHVGALLNGLGSGVGIGAGILKTDASLAGMRGGEEQRQEDWNIQVSQAKKEIEQLDQQIVAAEVRVEIAKKELTNQELQIEQSEQVQNFLQEKFTNHELYKWMVKELSRTFRQVYNLAFDVAKTAERTYQFELGIKDSNFIQFGYFDGLYQGLLAGEKLGHDVKRMDIAYLERDKRELEITKPISLASLNPQQLELLRETGECEFALPEILFDLDFPGQYFRRIQAVRVTIPAVTGPYTNVSAKLSLLSSAIRTESTADEDDYAYKGFDDPRFVHNLGGIQSIATSSAQDDAGLFELNFNDERYLPFEGSGAVSRWRLELPKKARQFDYHSISDVILTISYTARQAGGTLETGATKDIQTKLNNFLELVAGSGAGLGRVFSMKREFPDALHQLLSSNSAKMKILPEHFPFLLREQGFTLTPTDDDLTVVMIAPGIDGTSGPLPAPPNSSFTLALNTGPAGEFTGFVPVPEAKNAFSASVPRGSSALVDGGSEEWTLTQDGTLTVEAVDDILFQLKYTVS